MKTKLKWTTFTRRTNDPKLKWIETKLKAIGIRSRRNRESFHAPILEVLEKDLDAAWKFLTPFDDIPDDHPMFD